MVIPSYAYIDNNSLKNRKELTGGTWVQEGEFWKYQFPDGSYATGWYEDLNDMYKDPYSSDFYFGKKYYFLSDGVMLSEESALTYKFNSTMLKAPYFDRGMINGYALGYGGYWKEIENLTWVSESGESTTFGRGPKYSDLYPEATDPEFILSDTFFSL